MAVAIDRVTVRVPATVANLGAGFDVLAAAVGMHAEVTLAPATSPQVTVTGVDVAQDASNLIYRSATSVADRAGYRGAFALQAHSPIPLRSGLGSSAAAIVGGLVAANRLLGGALGADDLLIAATDLEGHPDNVAAALFGGVVVVARDGARLRWARILPGFPLAIVLVTPSRQVDTAAARAALPRQVALEDAVFNLGHSGLLLVALSQEQPGLLGSALDDRLHQPYRRHLVPGFDRVVAEAKAAGAYGAVLSGSGPTVAALTAPAAAQGVAQAMGEAFRHAGLESRILLTSIEPRGALEI
ncbi:MAG TPA: homoserine kinase [bacterium]|nr:homoserine kinase [bacterium]